MENDGDLVYWENKKLISKALNLADYRAAVMNEKLLDQLEETIDILVEISRVIKGMMIDHAWPVIYPTGNYIYPASVLYFY